MAEQFSISWLLQLTDKMSAPLMKVGQAMDDIDKKFSSTGGSMRKMGQQMSLYATTPIMGWATYASHQAGEFTIALREMGQSLESLPADKLTALKKDVVNMTEAMPYSVSQLAEFGKAAGKMNELGNVQGFITFMAAFQSLHEDIRGNAGTVAFMDMARAMALNQSQYERTGAVITSLSRGMNASASDIIGTASALGFLTQKTKMTNDQLLALSAWANTFGGEGGSALKRTINSVAEAALGKDVGKMGLMAKLTGFEGNAAGFQAAFDKSPIVVIQKFLSSIGEMGKEDPYVLDAVLNKFGLAGMKVESIARTAARTVGELARANEIAANTKDTELMKEASEVWSDFGNQMKMLMNTTNVFAAQFGKDIKPVFKAFVEIVKEGVSSFKNLPDWLRYSVEGLLGVAAAVGPLLIALGTLKGILGVLGLAKFGVALAAISIPAALLLTTVLALSSASKSLRENWDAITDGGFIETMKEFGAFVLNIATLGQINMLSAEYGGIERSQQAAEENRKKSLNEPVRSGIGGVLSSKNESIVTVILGDDLKVKGVENKGNAVTNVNTAGYLGMKHAY